VRVLVSGIDGFVGSHAAEYLGGVPEVELHGTILEPGDHPNLAMLKTDVQLHQADILDREAIRRIFRKVVPDRVIHLAGQAFVPTAMLDPVGTFEANIMGGVRLLEAARNQLDEKGTSPQVLIVSSGEVYGRNNRTPITEETPLRPENPYAASKASLDLIAQEYRRSFGVPVTVVRPFNHAGPRQSPLFVCSDFGRQFAMIAAGKSDPVLRVGNLDSQRDFTDVRDVVRAYWAILSHRSEHAVFNVCSGHICAIRDLIGLYEEATGIRVTVQVQESRSRERDPLVVAGSYARLQEATGWSPTIPLRTTIGDVYAYWQAQIASRR